MYKHLLVPIDGSELSSHAVDQSIGLARQLGARITGFVAEPLPPLPRETAGVSTYLKESEKHRTRSETHAREVLGQFAAKAAAEGVPFDGQYRLSDAVDDAIVAAAHEYGCDLVVMATHGRGAFGELLFGSHTKNIIARSKLPLLVLH
jgi:nucleotide-binding universal stress UspA family protein